MLTLCIRAALPDDMTDFPFSGGMTEACSGVRRRVTAVSPSARPACSIVCWHAHLLHSRYQVAGSTHHPGLSKKTLVLAFEPGAEKRA